MIVFCIIKDIKYTFASETASPEKSMEFSGKSRNSDGLGMVLSLPLTRNVTLDKFHYFVGLSSLVYKLKPLLRWP